MRDYDARMKAYAASVCASVPTSYDDSGLVARVSALEASVANLASLLNTETQKQSPLVSCARLYYTVAAGTDGQNIVGAATTTVELNGSVDPDGIVTLASNQFKLYPGVYCVVADVGIYQEDNSAHPFILQLYEVDRSLELAYRSVHLESDTEYVHGCLVHCWDVDVSRSYEIQIVSDASANAYLGQAVNLVGVAEYHTQVQIIKLS